MEAEGNRRGASNVDYDIVPTSSSCAPRDVTPLVCTDEVPEIIPPSIDPPLRNDSGETVINRANRSHDDGPDRVTIRSQ